MAALKTQTSGEVRFSGVGGPRMTDAGLTSLFPMDDLSLMGLVEVVPRLPKLIRHLERTVAAALENPPDVLVTIDSPGFNLRLARRLAGRGIALVHYVAPQVWAWRPGRARKIARFLDHLLALLPFEPSFFEAAGLPTTFVGHPAVDTLDREGDGPAFRNYYGIPAEASLLVVLPGSRRQEIVRLLPVFGRAVRLLADRVPSLHAVVPTLPIFASRIREAAAGWPVDATVVAGQADRHQAFAAADGALAASGTVALELAAAGVPMVVGYRMNWLTMLLARRLVKVRHVNLLNILLGRPVVPELLQDACEPARLADAVERILLDDAVRTAQVNATREVIKQLRAGDQSPSTRAAQIILQMAEQGPRPEHGPKLRYGV